MKTYVFRVVVEPDDDGWVAYSPALKERGGATWGHTSEEAMENIRQVLQMTVESLTNKESRFRRTSHLRTLPFLPALFPEQSSSDQSAKRSPSYKDDSKAEFALGTHDSGQRRTSWAPGFGSGSLDEGWILGLKGRG